MSGYPHYWWSRWLAAAVLLGAWLQCTNAAGLQSEPTLRIEADMHTAMINRIVSERTGRYAVTASDDKTARVWEVPSRQLLRVLRPPIGEGHEGKVYAVAMTPDGETVAVGGWAPGGPPHAVYLFNRSSGRLQQRLGGLPSVIYHLAFSPDGRWLAATLGGTGGVRVWEWRSTSTALADSDVKGDSYGASWSSDNLLATTSFDGNIRLFRAQPGALTRLAEVEAPGGQRPWGIAFSPDGRELAVGYSNPARVDILDGERLTLRHTPSSSGVANGDLATVAWSVDGWHLYAAGRWQDENRNLVRRWAEAGRGTPEDVPTVDNSVMGMATLLQNGSNRAGVLVGGADPAWGVLDAAGRWQPRQQPPIADFRNGLEKFKLSSDGRQVQFSFMKDGNALHTFAVAGRKLTSGAAGSLVAARTEGLPVKGWSNTTRPTLADQPIQLDAYEESHSLAIAPGDRSFVLGTIWFLRHFDAAGKQLWQRPVPGSPRSVNIPASGKLVVAAYGDGTIRWHRLSDGQELLAFFPHADRKRWVLWTPSGYYDASPGGEDLIGWHVNRGEDQAADFFPASRFRDRFWRPDVIDLVLQTLDEGQAVAQANATRGTRAQDTNVAQVLPPVVELVSAAEVSTTQPQITLRYRTRSAADAPVTGVRVRVNGQAQPEARNLQVEPAAGVQAIVVTVPPQDSQVQLFAQNRHGISTPVTVGVKWVAPAPVLAVPAMAGAAGFLYQPKLYVLAIGVSAYQHPDIRKLIFSAKDARDFTEAMQRQKGWLYRDVEVKLLTEADATRDNIADALEWLQRQVTQHDVGMLFVSGHGHNDPALGYTFLPFNANPDALRRTAVTMSDIQSTLGNIAGKAVAFLDTCYSGNALGRGFKSGFTDITGVINLLASAENGVVVFSSSTGRQISAEDPEWNNGAFTKALVEGISGKAARGGSGYVTHTMLDGYLTERVKELTGGRQSPVKQAPGGVNDFPLVVVKRLTSTSATNN